MFYIISTRLPLVYSDTTNRKFLKIFILGSLIYICVHYYLHLETRIGLMEHLKSKLLFIMAGDFLAACALAKFLSPVVPTNPHDDSDDESPTYSVDDKTRMMKELEDRKRAEAQKMMMGNPNSQQAMLQMQYAQAQAHALAQAQAQAQTVQLTQQSQQSAQARLKSKKEVKKDDSTTSSSSSSSS
jgi:hypothetical protein